MRLHHVQVSCPPGGEDVDDTERDTLAGHRRFHTLDPHGNRVELLAPTG